MFSMCAHIPRHLAGFVYCAFFRPPFIYNENQVSGRLPQRGKKSKLFHVQGSGFVLQVEEHRYAKYILHSHPRKRALKSPLKQYRRLCVAAGIKRLFSPQREPSGFVYVAWRDADWRKSNSHTQSQVCLYYTRGIWAMLCYSWSVSGR